MTKGLFWVVGGAAIGILLTITLLTLARIRGASQAGSLPPVLTVIPLPTATLIPVATPTQPPLPTPTPSPLADSPKQFSSGELVQIFGTEGGGLRMRANPSLTAEILMLGLESEVFEVIDGPREADSYTWWHLSNPFDPSKQGWAADQFLRSIEEG